MRSMEIPSTSFIGTTDMRYRKRRRIRRGRRSMGRRRGSAGRRRSRSVRPLKIGYRM